MSYFILTGDRKLYVLGHRLHHGTTGCVLTAIGVALAVHDRADVRKWFPDFIKERYERAANIV